MEDKKLVKLIGGISIALGCYYLFLLAIYFNIPNNVGLILDINTAHATYENALTTLFMFAAMSIIPLILYIFGGFLVLNKREVGRKIIIGTLVLTLFATVCNLKMVLLEIKRNPVINTLHFIFYTVISIALLFFLNSRKVKTIFSVENTNFIKYQNIAGKINDILVGANVIRGGKKTYLPAWSVVATFLLPIFLIYLAIEYDNVIFAWLIIPCMIIFPLIGGYAVKWRDQKQRK